MSRKRPSSPRADAGRAQRSISSERIPLSPITDAGTAHLDRLIWITRRQLVELVAELHPDRHASVTGTIRELIGNT